MGAKGEVAGEKGKIEMREKERGRLLWVGWFAR
jgi:hypothetical protein